MFVEFVLGSLLVQAWASFSILYFEYFASVDGISEKRSHFFECFTYIPIKYIKLVPIGEYDVGRTFRLGEYEQDEHEIKRIQRDEQNIIPTH